MTIQLLELDISYPVAWLESLLCQNYMRFSPSIAVVRECGTDFLQPTSTPLLVRTIRQNAKIPAGIRCVHTRLSESRLTLPSEQFVQFYYKTFDENRAGLSSLYVCDPI